jgi:hypothetical protein
MSSVIQIKRRINGVDASPATAGAKEGELALNFPKAAGATDKPKLYAFDGVGWRTVNPDTTITTQSIALGGAGTDIGVAYTTWATTPANTITGNVVIATFGTPAQAYVLTNPAAPGTAASWTSLGGAVAFATTAEVLAGTDAAKAINAVGLQSRIVKTPNATPANVANILPVLDATGYIPSGFLSLTGLSFGGALDPTAVYAALTPAPVSGEFHMVSKAGAVSATWAAQIVNPPANVAVGDLLFYEAGTVNKWHHIANSVDTSTFVPLAGTANMTGAIAFKATMATKKVFDGFDGIVDRVVIDGGTY